MARQFPFPSAYPLKKQAPAHLVLGRGGEDAATDFLMSLGYRIDARNVRLGRDEIDIITFDPVDCVLVFVEVKTCKVRNADFPVSMRAGYRKKAKAARAVRKWVAREGYEGGYRIDLVCVEAGVVSQHIKELSWT